ncbi:MAG: competence protein CoiA family protein [Caryophanon sp.]|nr:competence protein CoiA family protein [Caryophanon sp.]
MFVAKHNEKPLCTLDYTKEALRTLRQSETFTCPCCNEPVILKVGNQKLAHFAHRQAGCEAGFSERESAQHLQGKALLYTFCQRFIQDVELEPYIHVLQQRPDVRAAQYAIEFQCSAISYERLVERTDGYTRQGYVPIWIPVARHKKLGWQIISLSQLEKACLQMKDGLAYCITLSPTEEAFIYYSYAMQLSATKFYAYVMRVPIHEQQFPFYVPTPISKDVFIQLCEKQQSMRERMLLQRLRFSKEGVQDNVLQLAYMHYGGIMRIPFYVGIYVPYAHALSMPPVDWQLYYVVWRAQYKKMIREDEEHFCAFSNTEQLCVRSRQALYLYEDIVMTAPANEAALFQVMYDKIVAPRSNN